MASTCDPECAPVGDVVAALMMVDSRLKAIHSAEGEVTERERQEFLDQLAKEIGPVGIDDMLDGTCTLIYMYMTWLRGTHEQHGKDVIEYVVPTLVASMRLMPKSIRPEVIPMMAGLVVAAGTSLSPNLWRRQYGEWTDDEMTALEATAFLLAEHISRITEDPEFATRMITNVLTGTDPD
ncbi:MULTISPECIES: hypothetical protein [unclassified Streptomyces]|uniref:hypothetical protein n=1 Tax=unclassified Streptomyces TaxID=2593676 RepID=UPI00380B33DC